MVAAPHVHMTPERPVLVEWRDPTGVWQLPTVVTETRAASFDTIVLRPTGPAECISESQVASPGGGMRVTARAVQTSVFPSGARIPVTSLQLAGDRIAFWTIMPLQPGDHVELMARTADGTTLRAELVFARVLSTEGSWLSRIDCDAENPRRPPSRGSSRPCSRLPNDRRTQSGPAARAAGPGQGSVPDGRVTGRPRPAARRG